MGDRDRDVAEPVRLGCRLDFVTRDLIIAFAFGAVVDDQAETGAGGLGYIRELDLRAGGDALG